MPGEAGKRKKIKMKQRGKGNTGIDKQRQSTRELSIRKMEEIQHGSNHNRHRRYPSMAN